MQMVEEIIPNILDMLQTNWIKPINTAVILQASVPVPKLHVHTYVR